MPQEILDVERFAELSEQSEYYFVKRLENIVKIKLRTKNRLYTLKVDPLKAEEVMKKLRCNIKEF